MAPRNLVISKPLSPDLPREQMGFLYLADEEKTGARSTFFTCVKLRVGYRTCQSPVSLRQASST